MEPTVNMKVGILFVDFAKPLAFGCFVHNIKIKLWFIQFKCADALTVQLFSYRCYFFPAPLFITALFKCVQYLLLLLHFYEGVHLRVKL